MATRDVRITESDTMDTVELDQWDDYVQMAVTEGYFEDGKPPATVAISMRPDRARKVAAMLNHLADRCEHP